MAFHLSKKIRRNERVNPWVLKKLGQRKALYWVFLLSFAWAQDSSPANSVRCPRVSGALEQIVLSSSDRDQLIDAFLKKMPAYPVHGVSPALRKSEKYKPFLEALSEVNFQRPGFVRIRLDGQNLVIDPRVVEGWKQIGLVKENGNFNFAFDLKSALKKFARATGFKIVASPKGVISTRRYFSHIRRGEFFGDDIHSVLFHLPYLISAERRVNLQLISDYLDLEAKIGFGFRQVGQDLLTLFYEGPTGRMNLHPKLQQLRSKERMLYGPAQIEFGMGEPRPMDWEPERDIADMQKSYQEGVIDLRQPHRSLNDNEETQSMLLAIGHEMKAWTEAIRVIKAKKSPATLGIRFANRDSENHFEIITRTISRNPELIRQSALFNGRISKLLARIESVLEQR